jgi:hypothetical protein
MSSRLIFPFTALCAFAACSGAKQPSGSDALAQLSTIPVFASHVKAEPLVRVSGGFSRATGAWRVLGSVEGLLPARAGDPLRVVSTDDEDLWIELAPEAVSGEMTEQTGNAVVVGRAAPETDLVYLAEAGRVEEVRLLRGERAPRVFSYRVTLGPSAGAVKVRGDVVEVLDREGTARIRTEPMFAIDAKGSRAPLSAEISAGTLTLRLDDAQLAYPIAVDPAWTTGGSLMLPRYGHRYAHTGGTFSARVHVIGGHAASGVTASVESCDSICKNDLNLETARENHAVAELSDGSSVVTGGTTGPASAPIAKSEHINGGGSPAMSAMATARAGHMSAVVSGKVLVVGGIGASGLLSSAELGTAATSGSAVSWSAAASMPVARASATATAITASRVLVAGGQCDLTSTACAQAYIYDGPSNSWTAAGTMTTPRRGHSAALLASGKVLVAGGLGSGSAAALSSAEIYDPATNTWTAIKPMSQGRVFFGLGELVNGRVLAAGGATTAATELYDVSDDTWLPAGSMAVVHQRALGAVYPLGLAGTKGMMVAGGSNPTDTYVATVETFELLGNGRPCTTGAECNSTCCTTVCGACSGDAGIVDTGMPPIDTGTPPIDTGVVDTGAPPADTGTKTDSTVTDTSVVDSATTDGSLADTTVEDTAVEDGATEDSSASDTGEPSVDAGSLCTSNAQCTADRFCDDGRCAPRSERPALGCACDVGRTSSASPLLALLFLGAVSLPLRRRAARR